MEIAKMGRHIIAVLVAVLLSLGAAAVIGYEQGLPTLSIVQTIESPQPICLNETATVTLQIEVPRAEESLTADVMIVIDRSADSQLERARDIALRVIDRLSQLNINNRVGLVSFATEATLDAPLTPVLEAEVVRDKLADLVPEGQTAMGEGIAVATAELDFTGRRDALLIQILLTDGRWNSGRDPLEAAQGASELGVVIYTVGVGRFVNHNLLAQIAETTGGQFFSTFTESLIDQILKSPLSPGEPIATDIEIVETLTRDISYKSTLENMPPPTRTLNADGTTTLSWRVASLLPGETWTTRYTVSGSRMGLFALHQSPSVMRFTDFRGRQVERELPDLSLEVGEECPRPTAAFSFTPAEPTIFDEIQFTDESSVEDGQIVEWIWNFGDGTTSTQQHPRHRYAADGEYLVTLTTITDKRAEDSTSQTIRVFTPKIMARRTIDTFIPLDQTIPKQTFRVTIEIQANVKITGLGLDEDIPDGWEFQAVEHDSAQFRKEDLQWIFDEVLEPGTTKTIIYEVTVPEGTAAGKYWIYGTIGSALPPFSKNVDGDKQIEILPGFPIPIVIAHWDVGKNTLDLQGFPDHTIDDRQIEQAREWWREGIEVPFTEDENGKKQVIDLEMMQQLEAYWLTGTSVFEPLPQEEAADAP